MRLKIQEQRELNFVSRIIQCPLAIGNCSLPVGQGGGSAGVLQIREEADDANKVSRRRRCGIRKQYLRSD